MSERESISLPPIHPSAALSSLPSFFLPLSFLLYPLNEQSLFGCRQFAQMRRLSSMYLFAPCLPFSLQRREIGPEVRSSASYTYQSIFEPKNKYKANLEPFLHPRPFSFHLHFAATNATKQKRAEGAVIRLAIHQERGKRRRRRRHPTQQRKRGKSGGGRGVVRPAAANLLRSSLIDLPRARKSKS